MTPECRHIKTSGGKCGSPALRGQPYCYFHARLPNGGSNPRATRQEPSFLPLAFQSLENRGAIQHAIGEVGAALIDDRIDPRRARLLLYGLQVASGNLKSAEKIVLGEPVA
jgi:hypothetical protein